MPLNNRLIEFENLCIYTISVFDLGIQFYKENKTREIIINELKERLLSHHNIIRDVNKEDVAINQRLYDCEFANKNKDSNPFEISFNIDIGNLEKPVFSEEANKFISAIKIFDKIPSILLIESYGIGILRTKWDFA